MKLFIILTSIFTSMMIMSMIDFGLFQSYSVDYSNITNCIQTSITPIDLIPYEDTYLILTKDGIYTQNFVKIYSEQNCQALEKDNNYLYLIHNNNQLSILENWKLKQQISIPIGQSINDFVIQNQKIYLTLEYSFSDILGIYLKLNQFCLLECDFEGECNFIYDICGTHLSGIEIINNIIYIADTFKKQIIIYNLESSNIEQILIIQESPIKIVKVEEFIYFTCIPKLLELLDEPKLTSLYELKQGKIATMQGYQKVGMILKEKLLFGNNICQQK